MLTPEDRIIPYLGPPQGLFAYYKGQYDMLPGSILPPDAVAQFIHTLGKVFSRGCWRANRKPGQPTYLARGEMPVIDGDSGKVFFAPVTIGVRQIPNGMAIACESNPPDGNKQSCHFILINPDHPFIQQTVSHTDALFLTLDEAMRRACDCGLSGSDVAKNPDWLTLLRIWNTVEFASAGGRQPIIVDLGSQQDTGLWPASIRPENFWNHMLTNWYMSSLMGLPKDNPL